MTAEERKIEIWDALKRVIERCGKEKTDLLFIAGDLFHRQPLLRELKEVDYLFSTIPETRIVLIAGNHDYIKKNSYYRTFQWSSNVFMLKSEVMEKIEFEDLDLAVYGFSYYKKEITESFYDSVSINDERKYHILLAHGGDAMHIPVDKSCLKASEFDYIAMGHIHKPQTIITDKMAYSGALEPIDKDDTGEHGYITGELTEKGCHIEFVPDAFRKYIHMEIPVDQNMTGYALAGKIIKMMEKQGKQNFFSIFLTGETDPDIIFDPVMLQKTGNIVDVCDATRPAYNFKKLKDQNKGNLIGKYIESFENVSEDSVEYGALCEGIRALMETKRGQV